MSHFKEHWFPYLLFFIIGVVIFNGLSTDDRNKKNITDFPNKQKSIIPDIYELSNSDADNLIRYGKILIDSTSHYLGPHGSVAAITNGLNCQNCHRESGTKLFTNNFLAVASTYPKFRERSGRMESVEFRINECLQRSLNGQPIDSLSKEMRAMVAYIYWTGKNIKKNSKEEAAGSKEISFLQRAANPATGKAIYVSKCKSCHGENGEGVLHPDKKSYNISAFVGDHSYAVSAGMYRLQRLASFLKYNMPLGATYQEPLLSNEEAWDAAAYINSLPHPKKLFAADWPQLKSKPVDYPFGPYADNFSERQHKYVPFDPIKKAKNLASKK